MTTLPDIAMVQGVNLRLRLINPADADYVYGLRTDPAYNLHMSQVSGTPEDQRRWIDAYKAREATLEELYYVIERRDGLPCGLVRLYNIRDETFTWGSWILDHTKPPKAALESAVLSFGIGFCHLDIPRAVFEVRRENRHAIAFYHRFGATQTGEDSGELLFEYSRSRFMADRSGYMAILEGRQR